MSNIKILNFYSINKKNLDTYKTYKKSCLQIYYFNPGFLIWLFLKKMLLINILSNCVFKIIKLLYDMWKIKIIWFAIYHLYYKK